MIDQAIREVIRTALGMPANSVRPANQNLGVGDTSKLFATVLLTGHEALGWDSVKVTDVPNSTNVLETISGMRRVMASVQFFGVGANTLARRLQARLQSSAMLYLMDKLGMGFEQATRVEDMTGFIDSLAEERARLILHLNVGSVETELMRTYGTFPFSISTPVETTTFEVTTP